MDEKTLQRFWSKVDKDGPVPPHCPELGPCWVWTAGTNWCGYGNISVGGRLRRAHRVAWEIQRGPITLHGTSDGACVLHKCDNRPCVRGSHLFVGTRGDNAADRDAKGRVIAAPGERNGRAVLTVGDVIAMRQRYADGARVTQLARDAGISSGHASHIIRGKRWAHVPMPAPSERMLR